MSNPGKTQATVAAVPVVAQPIMVQVTAPSSLQEGYNFDAVYNGEVFPVTVPRGGVKAGQTFQVPFLPAVEAIAIPIGEPTESPQHSFDQSESTPMLPISPPRVTRRNNPLAPLGTWQTNIFGCLSEGFCHPSLCNALWFPQILMGQVLTRMKLNWCGISIGQSYKYTTRVWMFLTLFLIYQKMRLKDCLQPSTTVWYSTLDAIMDDDDDDDDDDDLIGLQQILHDSKQNINNSNCTSDQADTLQTIQWVWFWATTLILIRLRRAVRRAHGISMGFPCEDCFCAMVCQCCTVAQLARQTANYTEQRAYYCTDTGLVEGWFGHRQEELERRHLHGHHLVHAHSLDQADRRRQPQQHVV